MKKRVESLIVASLILSVGLGHEHKKGSVKAEAKNYDLEERIVGGTVAAEHSNPWIVFLDYSPHEFNCGGSLIQPQWVLTAAHCIRHGVHITALAGANNRCNGQQTLRNSEDTKVIRNVSEVFIHDEYDEQTHKNDIALFKLNKPFSMSEYIKTIKMATSDLGDNEPLQVSGWGALSYGSHAKVCDLHTVTISSQPAGKCQNYRDFDDSTQICAGVEEGGKDACSGDSGGPLFKMEGDSPLLYGVVSHGKKCGAPGVFGVYTKVSAYSDWIKKVIEESNPKICFCNLIYDDYIS